jgi:hypothetical protein
MVSKFIALNLYLNKYISNHINVYTNLKYIIIKRFHKQALNYLIYLL